MCFGKRHLLSCHRQFNQKEDLVPLSLILLLFVVVTQLYRLMCLMLVLSSKFICINMIKIWQVKEVISLHNINNDFSLRTCNYTFTPSLKFAGHEEDIKAVKKTTHMPVVFSIILYSIFMFVRNQKPKILSTHKFSTFYWLTYIHDDLLIFHWLINILAGLLLLKII